MKVLRCSVCHHVKYKGKPCPYCSGLAPEKVTEKVIRDEKPIIRIQQEKRPEMKTIHCVSCNAELLRTKSVKVARCIVCRADYQRKYQRKYFREHYMKDRANDDS